MSAIKVLLVEDDETIRDALAELLRGEGYEVLTAYDGLNALEQLADGAHPDLIMLDWCMPRVNGADFLRDRRRLSEVIDIPILVLSASLTASKVASVREGLPVIRKPFDVDELLALIANLTRPRVAALAPERQAHA